MKISIILSLFIMISCDDSVKDSSNLPGRMGNLEMSLKTDPRAIPAVTKVMSEYSVWMLYANWFSNIYRSNTKGEG